MRKLVLTLAATALLGAAGLQAKPPEHKGKPVDDSSVSHGASAGGNASHEGQGELVHVTIEVGTARRIAVDLGLTGQSALPPGIRRNLARGKPLPPGIAKKMLPAPYLRQLPVYPGYEWGMVGSDLVLLQAATGLIADVLTDVFN